MACRRKTESADTELLRKVEGKAVP